MNLATLSRMAFLKLTAEHCATTFQSVQTRFSAMWIIMELHTYLRESRLVIDVAALKRSGCSVTVLSR